METITSFDQLDLTKYYTYQDYLTWKFQDRVELFLGKVFKMSPAPNRVHQQIVSNLTWSFNTFLRSKQCNIFPAPFDVRLPVSRKTGKEDTVVQPDIVVICDPNKLDDQGCNGAPDIVVEILSPGNSRKEMKEKFEIYEASLIPEYWIVDPGNEDVTIYTLNDREEYIGSKPFVTGENVDSSIISGLSIEVVEIFRK